MNYAGIILGVCYCMPECQNNRGLIAYSFSGGFRVSFSSPPNADLIALLPGAGRRQGFSRGEGVYHTHIFFKKPHPIICKLRGTVFNI